MAGIRKPTIYKTAKFCIALFVFTTTFFWMTARAISAPNAVVHANAEESDLDSDQWVARIEAGFSSAPAGSHLQFLECLKLTDVLCFVDVERALQNCERAIALAEKLDDPDALAVALLDKAHVLAVNECREPAREYYDRGRQSFSQDASNELKLHFYSTMASLASHRLFLYSENESTSAYAGNYCYACQQLYSKVDDPQLAVLHDMSAFFNLVEGRNAEFDSIEAGELEARLLVASRRFGLPDCRVASLLLAAKRESTEGRRRQQTKTVRQALEICASTNNQRIRHAAYKCEGIRQFRIDNDRATGSFRSCMNCSKGLGSRALLLTDVGHVIAMERARGNEDFGIELIEDPEILDLFDTGSKEIAYGFLEIILDTYIKSGDEEKAADCKLLVEKALLERYRDEQNTIPTLAETDLRPSPEKNGSKTGWYLWWTLVSASVAAVGFGLLVLLTKNRERTGDEQSGPMTCDPRLDRLAGGIAHDFNNLLTGVMFNAEMLQMTAGGDRELLERSASIMESAEQAAELSRSMLTYTGMQRLERRPSCLNKTIKALASVMETTLGSRQLVLDLSPEVVCADMDAGQIDRVLLNLISNAAQASDEDSVVIVRTGIANEGVYPPTVFFEVEDQGCGMESARLAQVFDPFFSGRKGSKGLGLSIVYGIVKAHGGTVTALSTVGEGTSFHVTLGGALETVDCDESVVPETKGVLRGNGCVLIVDDEAIVRQSLSSILQPAGWDVLEASNGAEALTRIDDAECQISCILLDVVMPVMDGTEFLERIAALDLNIPVIIVSGYSECGLNQFLRFGQVSGIVQKPFRSAELWKQIRSALSASDSSS